MTWKRMPVFLLLAVMLMGQGAGGVGLFIRADCTTLTSPVAGQSWCFDATAQIPKVWNGAAWVQSPSLVSPNAAGTSRLTWVSATSIQLGLGVVPLKVGGTWIMRAVSAVVTCTNAGLAGATTYFVYVYDAPGTTCTISASGHSTDSAFGIETLTGDTTRTLVGMARTQAVPGALTAAVGAGGNVNAGTHSYKVTFVVGANEGPAGTVSNQVNPGVASQIALTAIPLGAPGVGVTARKIYRTVVGDTGNYLLLTTLADNTTTTYTDNTADAGLGAAAPTLGLFEDDNGLRGVLSYFNRRGIGLVNTFTANRSTTSTSYVELHTEIRANFLTWSDEAATLLASGLANDTVASNGTTAFGVDSTTAASDAQTFTGATSADTPVALSTVKNGLSEGFHFVTILGGNAAAGTLLVHGGAIGVTVSTTFLSVGIRG